MSGRIRFVFIIGVLIATPAWAQFEAKNKDPFDLCAGLEKRLPITLSAAKALLAPTEINVLNDADYCEENACEVHALKGPGYSVRFLVERKSGEITPLGATVSEYRWRLLTPLRVGDNISTAESFFGFKSSAASARITVNGVCSQIQIDYRQRVIQSMSLDCQVCH